jgi:endonuclease YncB( thermonuclease family)
MMPLESDRERGGFLISLLLIVSISCHPRVISNPQDGPHFQIIRIIDGDTIEVDTVGLVRLIGVDTPELYHPTRPVQYLAEGASQYTKSISDGKNVRLEFDRESFDKYGRRLAYVYFEDGRMLNAEIIKNGYGFAYTKYPFRYIEKFIGYEREAREKGFGLWRNEGMDEYRWNLANGAEPFLVYEMENDWWAIKIGSFVKVRLTDEQLRTELSSLRTWINEFNQRDLEECLRKNGWKKEIEQ